MEEFALLRIEPLIVEFRAVIPVGERAEHPRMFVAVIQDFPPVIGLVKRRCGMPKRVVKQDRRARRRADLHRAREKLPPFAILGRRVQRARWLPATTVRLPRQGWVMSLR